MLCDQWPEVRKILREVGSALGAAAVDAQSVLFLKEQDVGGGGGGGPIQPGFPGHGQCSYGSARQHGNLAARTARAGCLLRQLQLTAEAMLAAFLRWESGSDQELPGVVKEATAAARVVLVAIHHELG